MSQRPGEVGTAGRFDVVVLVASAGGLEALSTTLAGLTPELPAALVVQQHLGGHSSMLVEILDRLTPLTVRWADDGVPLEPGHVHVARPRQRLEVLPDGTLASAPNTEGALALPHDALLRSLAQSYGPRGLAVVLSGMGRDGRQGAVVLHGAGGTVLAQQPETAQHAGMPTAAVEAGAVDLVVPLAELGGVVNGVVAGTPLPPRAAERVPPRTPFGGDDEVSALFRSTSWRDTPLGPVDQWPPELRAAATTALDSPIGVLLLWGPDLVQLYNQRFRVLMGDRHPAGLGRRYRDDRDSGAEASLVDESVLAEVLAGGSRRLEDALRPIVRHGTTEDAWFDLAHTPLRRADGTVAGVQVTATETTARVLARRRLASLHRLAAATAGAEDRPAAFRAALRAVTDPRGDVSYAVGWSLDRTGRARLVEAVGARAGGPLAPRSLDLDGPDPEWPAAAVLRDGHGRLVAAPVGRLEQDVEDLAPSRAFVAPLADGGQPYGVVALGLSPRLPLDRERTEFLDRVQRETSAALTRAGARERERERTELLAHGADATTEFLSRVSRELRTPLAAVLAALAEAGRRSPDLPAELARELASAQRDGQRLRRLVDTLLDYTETEAGRRHAHPEPVDLAELTAAVASSFHPAAAAAGLKLEVELADLAGPVWVDPRMWETVVAHLLSNAVKFTWEGSIGVFLRQLPKHVELVVRDTGVGVPVEEQDAVFARFHRVHGTAGRSDDGLGVGLALTDELVRLHGGRVRLTSQVGAGTRVTVWLPVAGRRPARSSPDDGPAATDRGAVAAGLAAEALGWSEPRDQPGPPRTS